LAKALWTLVAPVRLYVRHSPIPKGKWRISKIILEPVLSLFPQDMTVWATVPGGRISLLYSEDLGKRVLISGGFEMAEIAVANSRARRGSVAVDVGANVGMFTVPLATAVGPTGAVLAFEPHPANAERLRGNCRVNGRSNVVVHEVALAESEGTAVLKLGKDAAYGSTVQVWPGKESGETLSVPSRTLDGVWREAGQPDVSFVKVDVEGAELQVLSGARDLLATCSPSLLLEANSPRALDELRTWLAGVGYVPTANPNFEAWNHLFLPRSRDT
jgi:FkbM family methyltransferase